MRKLQIILTLFLTAHATLGQYTFQGISKLDSVVNSTAEEITPMLSPDGSRLYFVRASHKDNIGGPEAGQDIWFADKTTDGGWSTPVNNLPALNNGDNNAMIGFNAPGDSIFLINNYSSYPRRKIGISYSALKGEKWTSPREFGVEVKTENDFYGMFIHSNQKVVLLSMMADHSLGEEDLYVSLREPNGGWSKPIHLGGTINTPGFEISPFLSEDESTLFFASDGHSGYGDADIFMATRLDEGWTNWSAPVNLGREINSPGFDAYFFERGGVAFFSSNRDGVGADIYTSDVTRPEPIVEELPLIAAVTVEEEKHEMLAEVPADSPGPLPAIEMEVSYTTIPDPISIYFAFDSDGLTAEAKGVINEVAALLTSDTGLNVEITGYTDSMGPTQYNQQLSERRALAVSRYLADDLSVPLSRLTIDGKGETMLLDEASAPKGFSANRRVELVFTRGIVAAQ